MSDNPFDQITPIISKITKLRDGASKEQALLYQATMNGMEIILNLWSQQLKQDQGQKAPPKASTAELLERALVSLAAPRRKVAVRDEKGDIIETIETPLT